MTNRDNREQQRLTVQSETSDRFTAAVDQLGSAQLDVRLGGIYGLERLMKDNPADQATVVEVLSAYLRVHAPRAATPAAKDTQPHPTADAQAAATVLGRQPKRRPAHVNLRGVDLAGVDLYGADLRGADLSHAMLRDADLNHANLRGADLSLTDLTGADLRDADLRDADLGDAILRGAFLNRANLTGAYPNDGWLGQAKRASAKGLPTPSIGQQPGPTAATSPSSRVPLPTLG